MRTRIAAVLIGVGLVVCLVGPSGATEGVSSGSCGVRSARTVAREGNALVVAVSRLRSPYGPSRYYACRGSLRRYLGKTTDVRYIELVTLRWPYVAYAFGEGDRLGRTAGLAVEDVNSGRARRCLGSGFASTPAARKDARLLRIRLNGVGSAGFSASYAEQDEVHPEATNYEVWKSDRDGCVRLDAGPGIAPRSLSIDSSGLTWLHGGTRRHARLR
jgi:hypothetical protein